MRWSLAEVGSPITTYDAYFTTAELLDDELVIRRTGMLAKAVAPEVRVPLDALVGTRFKDANLVVNGHLQLVLADSPSPSKPKPADPYTIVFRQAQSYWLAELHSHLEARVEANRARGVDAANVPVTRVAGRLEAAREKASNSLRFGRIVVSEGCVTTPSGSGPLAGARVTLDSAGEIDKRVTATRLMLTGPLAFGLRKKKDSRELYLLVEGENLAHVEKVDPKKREAALRFTAEFNSRAAREAAAFGRVGAAAEPPPAPEQAPIAVVPPGWYEDPRAESRLRWWDGTRWTDHVHS